MFCNGVDTKIKKKHFSHWLKNRWRNGLLCNEHKKQICGDLKYQFEENIIDVDIKIIKLLSCDNLYGPHIEAIN